MTNFLIGTGNSANPVQGPDKAPETFCGETRQTSGENNSVEQKKNRDAVDCVCSEKDDPGPESLFSGKNAEDYETVSFIETLSRDEMATLLERKHMILEKRTETSVPQPSHSDIKNESAGSGDNDFVTIFEIGDKEVERIVNSRTQRILEAVRERKRKITRKLKKVSNSAVSYVTKESLDILHKIESANKNSLLFSPIKQKGRRKTQADIDREIVYGFYKNPTPDAFGRLWERFRYGIHSYIAKIVGDWNRAEDLLQDTFKRTWEKRFMYNPEKSSFSTWLYTIARNLTFTQLKRDGSTLVIDEDLSSVFSSTLYSDASGASQNDDVYYVNDQDGNICGTSMEDITKRIFDASIAEINTMDPTFQKIIKMKNLRNMTLREISERLGMKESKVKNCYYKNKEILADVMREKYGELYSAYYDAKRESQESAF